LPVCVAGADKKRFSFALAALYKGSMVNVTLPFLKVKLHILKSPARHIIAQKHLLVGLNPDRHLGAIVRELAVRLADNSRRRHVNRFLKRLNGKDDPAVTCELPFAVIPDSQNQVDFVSGCIIREFKFDATRICFVNLNFARIGARFREIPPLVRQRITIRIKAGRGVQFDNIAWIRMLDKTLLIAIVINKYVWIMVYWPDYRVWKTKNIWSPPAMAIREKLLTISE